MKLDDYRDMAYQLMGAGPDYKGPVLMPSNTKRNAHPNEDLMFLVRLGKQHLHLLNTKEPK